MSETRGRSSDSEPEKSQEEEQGAENESSKVTPEQIKSVFSSATDALVETSNDPELLLAMYEFAQSLDLECIRGNGPVGEPKTPGQVKNLTRRLKEMRDFVTGQIIRPQS